jgi:hypothetical protein
MASNRFKFLTKTPIVKDDFADYLNSIAREHDMPKLRTGSENYRMNTNPNYSRKVANRYLQNRANAGMKVANPLMAGLAAYKTAEEGIGDLYDTLDESRDMSEEAKSQLGDGLREAFKSKPAELFSELKPDMATALSKIDRMRAENPEPRMAKPYFPPEERKVSNTLSDGLREAFKSKPAELYADLSPSMAAAMAKIDRMRAEEGAETSDMDAPAIADLPEQSKFTKLLQALKK